MALKDYRPLTPTLRFKSLPGFDEITTVLARYHYRSGVRLPVVLRGPSGGGVRAWIGLRRMASRLTTIS